MRSQADGAVWRPEGDTWTRALARCSSLEAFVFAAAGLFAFAIGAFAGPFN